MERISKIAPITSVAAALFHAESGSRKGNSPYCQQHNIGVINYSPMVSGLLTGAMTKERVVNCRRMIGVATTPVSRSRNSAATLNWSSCCGKLAAPTAALRERSPSPGPCATGRYRSNCRRAQRKAGGWNHWRGNISPPAGRNYAHRRFPDRKSSAGQAEQVRLPIYPHGYAKGIVRALNEKFSNLRRHRPSQPRLIGVHLSTTGGVASAVRRARDRRQHAADFFLQPPHVARFKDHCRAGGIHARSSRGVGHRSAGHPYQLSGESLQSVRGNLRKISPGVSWRNRTRACAGRGIPGGPSRLLSWDDAAAGS